MLKFRNLKGKDLEQKIDLVNDKWKSLDIDIEATGDKMKGEKNYPYEIGVNVTDQDNKVLFKCSLMISDIFKDEIKMNSAFFRNKIPFYNEKMSVFCQDKDAHLYKSVNIKEALEILNAIIKKFNIKIISAYNVSYDYEGINFLYDLRPSVKNQFAKLNDIDIMKLFTMTLEMFPRTRNKFIEFCKENGFVTASGNCIINAEVVYKFITKKLDFKEKHTGLEDLKIERKIRRWCIMKFKKANKPFIYELNTRKKGNLYKGENALLKAY